MKTAHKILCISVLVFMVISVTGCCNLSAHDLTPDSQPPIYPYWWPLDELYYGFSTLEAIDEATTGTLGHWFFLEVKHQYCTNIQAFITINGVEHEMEEWSGSSGKGLWVYRAETMCNSGYEYYYRIRYHRGLFGWATEMFGSAEQVLRSEVTEFGTMVWYIKDSWSRPTSSRVGEVEFISGYPGPRSLLENIIIIQRLNQSDIPYRISFIGLPYDETNFEIFQRPPAYQELLCGDYVEIGVRWNPITTSAHSLLGVGYQVYFEGKWHETQYFNITLTGRPYDETPP